MCEDRTLDNCAQSLNISIVTAFNWRHKILHAIENNYKPISFNENIYVKTYFTYICYKGNKNKHFTYEEKIRNKIDKRYCDFPLDVKILYASEGESLPLITAVMPSEKINDCFQNQILTLTNQKCYIHQEHINKYNIIESLINHNKNLPNNIKRKYGFNINSDRSYCTITDNIKDDERKLYFFGYLNSWIKKFKGIATKYIGHYYNFFSLIHSQENFDYMKLFFELLQKANYSSVGSIRTAHLENY